MVAPSVPTAPSAVMSLLNGGSLVGTWTLDPARSSVSLRSKSMWGMAPIKGSFDKVSGEGTVSPTGAVTGTIQVATASLNTKSKKRDKHLQSADFFDSENNPHIVFTATSLTPGSDGLTLTGTLQVRGRTQPVTMPVQVSLSGNELVQVDGEVTIDRSEFGLSWNQMGMASMKNTIAIRAVFTQR